MSVGFWSPGERGVLYVNLVLGCQWVDERVSHIDDDGLHVFNIERHPRDTAFAAAVFSRTDVGDAEIWRLADDPRWILCTDKVKSAVERLKPTNLDFREVGSIAD